MSQQPRPDQTPVYHGPTLCIDAEDLDPSAYEIVEITARNAQRYGYQPDQVGLKVQRHRRHVADAEDLADAIRLVADDLVRSICLVEESMMDYRSWEVMLARPGLVAGS